MKILILLRSSVLTSRGGAEVQAEFIRQACANAGHKVHSAFESKKPLQLHDDTAHYHVLPNWGRLRSYMNYSALNRLVRDLNPDIIYQR